MTVEWSTSQRGTRGDRPACLPGLGAHGTVFRVDTPEGKVNRSARWPAARGVGPPNCVADSTKIYCSAMTCTYGIGKETATVHFAGSSSASRETLAFGFSLFVVGSRRLPSPLFIIPALIALGWWLILH